MSSDLVIGMAGAGGDGIVAGGEALTAAAPRDGYHAIMTKSFGSQIRGGESSCRVRVSTQPVLNPGGALDVAVALNWDDFLKFGAELPVSGKTVVIYESKTGVAPDKLPLVGIAPDEVLPVPITDITKESAGTDRAKNTVVLGLLAGCARTRKMSRFSESWRVFVTPTLTFCKSVRCSNVPIWLTNADRLSPSS